MELQRRLTAPNHLTRIDGRLPTRAPEGSDRALLTGAGAGLKMRSEAQFIGAIPSQNLLAGGQNLAQPADILRYEQPHHVVALVGMAFEARIAAGPGVQVVCRGPGCDLKAAAERAIRQGCRGIISFGVAGGLIPDLRAGDWVIASTVLESQSRHKADAMWSSRLLAAIVGAKCAPILGVDTPVSDPAKKRELHALTGAAAVDMESHVMARLAADHGLVFAAVRVIVDSIDRAIPHAALCGMGVGGPADARAVLRDLFARPSQLSPLARIALDAYIARVEMVRVRRLLGPHFGLVELAPATVPEVGVPEIAEAAQPCEMNLVTR